MADWATFVVVSEDGDHEMYESRFGAVGIDLDLLAGPDVVLPFIRAHAAADGHWRDDVWCQGAALVDLGRKVLLMFAWEGPTARMRHRAAAWELLRHAWPGWELRWTFDGPADLRAYLGLDPETVRDQDRQVCAGIEIEPDDVDPAEADPLFAVVTLGADRCCLVWNGEDHPIAEGPGLLDRLAAVPDHGTCTLAVQSGIHVDPERRRVGWWLLDAQAEAYEMASRWPGWRVEFWQDRWDEHVRASNGRFTPPPIERTLALDEVREEARQHWSGRRGSGLLELVEALKTADPGTRFGSGFVPDIPADLTRPALLAIDAAWRDAARPVA
ncbi:hypothetical protein [Streptomyces sp. NPDC059909]|uniref:hypothetical protein n=1 Tax=Streptomyces sp. NPDC059909 TaxID=3346998 RepID=UPI00364C47D6